MYCCFVDVLIYMDLPPKWKKLNDVCEEMKKTKAINGHDAQKGAELNFCTYQYLYNSKYLGVGLGRKLFLPPLEKLGTFCGIFSVEDR